MYATAVTVEDVGADTDGTVRAVFSKTEFDYGDIANGDTASDWWSYSCNSEEASETYLDTLTFTVKVSWLADP